MNNSQLLLPRDNFRRIEDFIASSAADLDLHEYVMSTDFPHPQTEAGDVDDIALILGGLLHSRAMVDLLFVSGSNSTTVRICVDSDYFTWIQSVSEDRNQILVSRIDRNSSILSLLEMLRLSPYMIPSCSKFGLSGDLASIAYEPDLMKQILLNSVPRGSELWAAVNEDKWHLIHCVGHGAGDAEENPRQLVWCVIGNSIFRIQKDVSVEGLVAIRSTSLLIWCQMSNFFSPYSAKVF